MTDLSPQQQMRQADPLGDRIHFVIALLTCLAVASDTAPTEIAFAALSACFLVRLPHIYRFFHSFFRQTLVWIIIFWAAYAALSLLWSIDRPQGLQELLRIRFFLLPLLIYPVLDRSGKLIIALLLGVVILHASQLAELLEIMPASWDRDRYVRTRYGGWNQPVVSANLIACAAALHLSASLAGKGRLRLFSIFGLALALVGLILTGSRGPWIAALVILPLQLLITLILDPRLRRGGLAILVVSVLVIGVSSFVFADQIQTRVRQATDEITRVVHDQDYDSHTGARILMAKLALEMFREKPLIGYGGGSYHDAAAAIAQKQNPDSDPPLGSLVHNHAHNAYFHEAATRGIPGLLLIIAVFLGGAASAFRRSSCPDHPWRQGVGWAVLVMALCAMFDHPLITQNSCYMTMMLMSFALADCSQIIPEPDRKTAGTISADV